MTHAQLIKIAKKWLVRARGCSVVLCEKQAPHGESPDSVGWRGRHSILIECKVSLADFRKDGDKWFRRSNAGIGQQRFYMAPEGVIPVRELPEGWGLLEVKTGQVVKTVVEHELNYYDEQRAAAELPFLVACLRQAQVKLAARRKRFSRPV